MSDKVEINRKPANSGGPRIKYSMWIVTINTNKHYTGAEQEFDSAVSDLENAVVDLLDYDNIQKWVVIKESGKEFNSNVIKRIDTQHATELGTKQNKLHAHIAIKVTHYTKVQLDLPAIAQFIKSKLGLGHLPYVNFKRMPHVAEMNLENYLGKAPLGK